MVVPVMPDEHEQVLILAGDIGVVDKEWSIKYFLEEMGDRFRAVLMVLGNHEYYHVNIIRTPQKLEDMMIDFANVYLLNDDVIQFDDVQFIGGTLWTNMNNNDILMMHEAELWMNDYKQIRTGPASQPWMRKLKALDTMAMHMNTRRFIFDNVDATNKLNEAHGDETKNVVITHHAPSYMSVHEKYKGDKINGAYVSELFEDIADREIALWVHGHTHYSFDYDIEGTRVVCNPRGYVGYEVNPNFIENLEIEL